MKRPIIIMVTVITKVSIIMMVLIIIMMIALDPIKVRVEEIALIVIALMIEGFTMEVFTQG